MTIGLSGQGVIEGKQREGSRDEASLHPVSSLNSVVKFYFFYSINNLPYEFIKTALYEKVAK